MATVIGGVAITINAVSKGFTKGVDKARSVIGKFIGGIGSLAKAMTSLRAVIIGVAVRAFQQFIKRSLDSINVLSDTAIKLGIATDKLQALRMAAELSGVKITTLDMALQRFTRRVSEAAIGTGEAQAAIKELGLDARHLVDIGPDQAMREVADAFGKVGSQADKVRLAFKLFDSEGVALVNVLKDGSAGLDAIEQRMRDLGIAITGVEAQRVVDANKAIKEMSSAFGAVTDRVAITLAPAIQVVAERVSELLITTNNWGNMTMKVVGFVVKSIAWVITAIERVILGWMRFRDVVATGTGFVLRSFLDILRAANSVALFFGSDLLNSTVVWMETFVEANKEVADGLRKNTAEFAKSVGAIGNEINILFAEAEEALIAAGQSTDDGKKKMQDYTGAIDEAAKRFAKLQSVAVRVIESIKTPQEKMAEETVKLAELWVNGLITMEQWSKALDLVQKKYQAIADAAKEAAKPIIAAPLAGAEVAGSAAAVRGTLDRGNAGLNDLVTQGRLQFKSLQEIEQEQRRQSRYLQRLADGTVIANLN